MSDRIDTERLRRVARNGWVAGSDVRTLCDEVDRTREALENFGWHEASCAYLRRHTRPGRPKRDGRCDCGLAAALGGQEAPEPEPPPGR